MIRRPPRSTLSSSSAASDVYKRQVLVRDLEAKYQTLKSSSDQHEARLWARCTIQQVSELEATMADQIHAKASVSSLSEFVSEQSILNQAVMNELVVGRWIWNSHRTKAGGTVPWNVQTVSTRDDAFQWKKDSVKITAVQAGLYEICWGFFTKSRPSVQLLLNGQPCLASSANLHTHGTRASGVNHPAGNVTGHTVVDFLALPARAKLSVTFSGEGPTEGFLSLRKL
eukprot:TRINITY_DN7709_c0_g1_i2.p1 TRINITY_DN7709_c0_g1~~TRINITY_DN7709_c0_g1_i2.p1  ORF type:complete len:227 (+),score=55.56 TRINITY_DN7709_c0_g1_i2:104-784(+)